MADDDPMLPGYMLTPVGPPPPPPAPTPTGRNGFAVAALLTGIFGGFFISPIFAIMGLSEIRKTGQRGKGFAIAGLALSVVWLAVPVLFVTGYFAQLPDRDAAGDVIAEGKELIFNLSVGDCLDEVAPGMRFRVTVLPCAEPHDGEMFARFDLPGGSWPGDEETEAQASESCYAELAAYAPSAYADENVSIVFFSPSRSTWYDGDREVICLSDYADGRRTGSIEGT